jgi:hypothetical protein
LPARTIGALLLSCHDDAEFPDLGVEHLGVPVPEAAPVRLPGPLGTGTLGVPVPEAAPVRLPGPLGTGTTQERGRPPPQHFFKWLPVMIPAMPWH